MKITYDSGVYHIFLDYNASAPDQQLHVCCTDIPGLAIIFHKEYATRPDYFYIKEHFKKTLLAFTLQQLEENL